MRIGKFKERIGGDVVEKVKVSQLAKMNGISAIELLNKMESLGINNKTTSSILEEKEVEKIEKM